MYINCNNWKFRISETYFRYEYKENERVLACTYREEYCKATSNFLRQSFDFKKTIVLCFFQINLKLQKPLLGPYPLKKRYIFDVQTHRIIENTDTRRLNLKCHNQLNVFLIINYPTIKLNWEIF